jgi:hypothetical protein
LNGDNGHIKAGVAYLGRRSLGLLAYRAVLVVIALFSDIVEKHAGEDKYDQQDEKQAKRHVGRPPNTISTR